MGEYSAFHELREKVIKQLTPQTHVTLHKLLIRRENEEYIIGRPEAGEFVSVPESGKMIIELLQSGLSCGEVQAEMLKLCEAEVDIESFLRTLTELGFVKAVDQHVLDLETGTSATLGWVREHHVGWLFSRPVKLAYVVIIVFAGLTAVASPQLLPSAQDFWWFPRLSVVVLVNALLSMAILALHELSHLAAARSLGIPARIRWGTRLNNLVLQTDVTALWSLPSRQRYRVYVAGMACDLLLLSLGLLILAYLPLPVLGVRLVRSILLILVLGIFWQFQLFMRTDVYFVFMDLTGCRNLFNDSTAYLKYQFRRLWLCISPGSGTTLGNPLDEIPVQERRKVRFYAWFVLVGSTASLSIFVFTVLPILIQLLYQGCASVWKGITLLQLSQFMDGFVVLLVLGSIQTLFVVTFMKTRRRRRD